MEGNNKRLDTKNTYRPNYSGKLDPDPIIRVTSNLQNSKYYYWKNKFLLKIDALKSFVSELSHRRGVIIRRSLLSGVIIFGSSLFFSFAFWFINSFNVHYPSLLNFGDIMLDRGVRLIMTRDKKDPFINLKKNQSILGKYDYVIANLEGPIVEMDRSLCQQKIYSFQFANNSAALLKESGINMVNIGNNHSYDCYSKGLQNTKLELVNAGITYIGDNVLEKSYVVKEVGNKKIAFVGLDTTIATIPVVRFYSLVKELKSKYDYVVVNIHWGVEYSIVQSESQEIIAHNLIDSGADLIFGHHPHVVEPVEVYKNGIIFYSLGNLIFDQEFGNTTVGIGAGVEFRKNKTVVNIYPFNIKKYVPEFMKDNEAMIFCDQFLSNVEAVGCTFEVKM